jgi:hypothetical protein
VKKSGWDLILRRKSWHDRDRFRSFYNGGGNKLCSQAGLALLVALSRLGEGKLMNAPIRSLFVLAVLVPLAVAVVGLRWGLNALDLGQALRDARRLQELNQFLKGSIRHQEERKVLAEEVVAQRCSLQEALDQIQEMNREWLQEMEDRWPDLSRDLVAQYRRDWLEPNWCYWRLTQEIKCQLCDWPEQADAVLRRLDEEHQQIQGGNQTPSPSETRDAFLGFSLEAGTID